MKPNNADFDALLLEAQRLGFVGPGDVTTHVRHSLAFVEILREVIEGGRDAPLVADLGSGGGLPGLIMAAAMPEVAFVLVESSERRAAWLDGCLRDLGQSGHAAVLRGRAEEVGHVAPYRGGFDAVTARAFARPAITAECGAPLLRPAGSLVVSAAPLVTEESWPNKGLAQVGLGTASFRRVAGFTFVVSRLQSTPSLRFPRRGAALVKRALF